MDIQKILETVNIADKLDEDLLNEIGDEVVCGYDADLDSRTAWDEQNNEWIKLALQIKENKSFPWTDAANIKYPLLTTAALQFNARSYPSLVPSFDIVKAKPLGSAVQQAVSPPPAAQSPVGPGPQGMGGMVPLQQQAPDLQDIADKISTHMSYQVLFEMKDWEEDMDKLCLVLPIIGCAFKKTYFSQLKGYNCSELVLPKDLVVNYWTKSLETASRKTHRMMFTPNEFIERQREGFWKEYKDFEFGAGTSEEEFMNLKQEITKQTPPSEDENTPRQVLEQHTFWDLDDDGYKEPYIITVDYETKKVLRITPRFRLKDVKYHPKKPNQIAKICPREYFTKFSFIPNPDGSFYDLGFGLLLGSLNEAANTLLNQLVDSGTLSNLQSGFLAKGLRLGKSGDYKFRPGEWKPVNNTLDDLKKGIFPLPVREPSTVLFQLLGMLVQSGKEMASIAEIFTGKMPGQNTPASTTMATIEQGLKVFTSIYKRIYRALGKEFELLFDLNATNLPNNQDIGYSYEKDGVMIDASINSQLYTAAKVKIVPAADPNMVTETQKLMQLQSMMELSQLGQLNPQEITRRGLEIHGISGIAQLMNVPPPPPPLEIQIQQMKDAAADKDRQIEMFKVQSESQKRASEAMLNYAKAKQLGQEAEMIIFEAQMKREEAIMEMQMKAMELMFKQKEHAMDMQHSQEEHALDMNVKSKMGAQDLAMNEQSNKQTLDHNTKANEQKLKLMSQQKEARNAGGNKQGRVGNVEGKRSH